MAWHLIGIGAECCGRETQHRSGSSLLVGVHPHQDLSEERGELCVSDLMVHALCDFALRFADLDVEDRVSDGLECQQERVMVLSAAVL